MLIKQSQDDGAEEVTWRVSPVNDQLQAVNKHFPDTIRVLADASKLIASSFRQCSNKESCSTSGAKLEKWLSSPTLKPIQWSLVFSNDTPLREVDQNQDMEVHISRGSTEDKKNATLVSQQSPFHTPSSVSDSSDVVMLDPQGQSMGSGFVAFATSEEATKLNEMNGKIIRRKPLYVDVAQRKDGRKARLQCRKIGGSLYWLQ